MTTATVNAGHVLCPQCLGRKKSFAFINTGEDSSKHRSGWINCDVCKGAGSITDQHAQDIERGHEMRRARISAGESLFQAAQRMGISPVELSRIERGRG